MGDIVMNARYLLLVFFSFSFVACNTYQAPRKDKALVPKVQETLAKRNSIPSAELERSGVVKIGSLMWMRCSVGQTWDGANCKGIPKKFERSGAVRQTSSYAGYSDWRPPSVAELNSLISCPAGRSGLNADGRGRCLGDRGKTGNEISNRGYGNIVYCSKSVSCAGALIDGQNFPQTPLGDYWTYETDGTWFNYVSFIDGDSVGGMNNRPSVYLRMVRDDYSDKTQVVESDFDIRVKVSAKKADPSSLRHDLGIMQFDSTETSNQIYISYSISPKVKVQKFKERNIILVLNVVVEKDVHLVFMGMGVKQAQPEFKTIKVQLKKANSYAANGSQVIFDVKTFLKMLGGTQEVRNVKPKVSLAAIYYE